MLLPQPFWPYHNSAAGSGAMRRPTVLELDRRMAAFFDKAMYHVAREFGRDAPA